MFFIKFLYFEINIITGNTNSSKIFHYKFTDNLRNTLKEIFKCVLKVPKKRKRKKKEIQKEFI